MMTASMRCAFRYPRESLLEVKNKGCFGLQRNLQRYLFYKGISSHCHEKHINLQTIPVRITKRPPLFRTNNSREPVRRNHEILRQLPRVPRHIGTPQRCSTFGLLNVRSLKTRVDETLAQQRESSLDLMLLVETWHDTGSSCMQRLR